MNRAVLLDDYRRVVRLVGGNITNTETESGREQKPGRDG